MIKNRYDKNGQKKIEPDMADRTVAQNGAILARSRVYHSRGGRLWKTLDTSLVPVETCLTLYI